VHRSVTTDDFTRLIDFGAGEDADNVIVNFKQNMIYAVRHGSLNTQLNSNPQGAAVPANTWTHVALV
jgi:hypothetical protein